MGPKQAKRSSNGSSHSLKTITINNHSGPPTSPAPTSSPYSHDDSPYAHGHDEITPPAPARVLNRLSEIIDPRDLIQDELYLMTPTRHGSSSQPMPFTFRGLVQSLSGNELGTEEFIAHPNRPLAMWERQERVLQATRDRLEMLEMELQAARQSDNDTRSDDVQHRSESQEGVGGVAVAFVERVLKADTLGMDPEFSNDSQLTTQTEREALQLNMSFFDQKWDPTDRKNVPPQVNAWRNGHVNTASSPGYTENARKAQNSASGATIVGGKIVKPVHAKPRENLPSNVHGFHNSNNEGQSMKQTYAGSASRFSGPDFIPSPQKSSKHDTRNRSSASSAGGQLPTEGSHQHDAKKGLETLSSTGHIRQTFLSEAGELILPHLRNVQSAKTTVNAPDNNQNGEASAKMDAGKATRSIKNNSNFPCTYETCTRGFMTKKAFKAHKEEDHAYCRECDEDYEDGEELLKHKVNSNNHICCGICGQDFRSESGRDKHFRQSHPTTQEVVCPGCELIFESGNSLVAHIYGNHCKTRDGDVSRRINELKIRESRAAAAVFMDRVSHRPNNTSALIAAMQPLEIADHLSAAQPVDGGVPVTHHLIDDNAHDDRSTGLPSALIEGPETSHGESYTVTATEPGASDGLRDDEWPIPGQSMQKGKSKEESVIQGLNALKIGPPDGLQLKDPTNAHASTKPQKPMPMIGQLAEPTMPDHRGNIFTPESGSQHIIRTDWDSFRFVRNFNGDYDCPFVECQESYIEVNDLKWHLTSGYHQGTDPRCMKCSKVFKTIPGLVAHMERSDKCRIRETLGFGNVIHVVSGGFLGISGRHADGSIKIEVPDVPDDERYMLRYEGDDDDDEVPMLKPRLVLPPPHLRVGSTAEQESWN